MNMIQSIGGGDNKDETKKTTERNMKRVEYENGGKGSKGRSDNA